MDKNEPTSASYFIDNRWENIPLENIKKGMTVQLFNYENLPLFDLENSKILIAEEDAFFDNQGELILTFCKDWGEVIIDDTLHAHKICKKCGSRRNLISTTIEMMDNMALSQIDNLEIPLENTKRNTLQNIKTKSEIPSCKCGGKFIKTEPEITLDGLILYECPSCSERHYF